MQKNVKTCKNGHSFFKSTDCPTCPICENERRPKDNFLSHLGAPARRALENKGITDLEHFKEFTEKDILGLHGIGKSTIPVLKKLMSTENLSFKH